jgi:hypothetical protein
MKKLLLLLVLSFGLIGSANSKSNIPLPSNQDFIVGISQLSSILETPFHLELKQAELEAEQKLGSLREQYGITTDEEEKYAIDVLINKELENLIIIHFNLGLNSTLSPSDYGLFKNHLIFTVTSISLELEWTLLPSSITGGLFYTDGKSINYLYGKSRVSSLERLLRHEKFQFETTNPSKLAYFISDVLLRSGNTSASVIDDIRDIFRSNGYEVRIENPKQIHHEPFAKETAELKAKIEAVKANPALLTTSYQSELEHDQRVLELLKELAKDAPLPRYGGFTRHEMETLSHDELVKIAKEKGHESLSGIIKPTLTKLGSNWILEFTTLDGWMHNRNWLSLNQITFTPDNQITLLPSYKISTVRKTLNSEVYDVMPLIHY